MEMGRKEVKMDASIDVIGEDNLRNVLSRLPSSSFASAACVNRSWNHLCDTVLYTPKLSSAFSTNPSLQEAVEEVFNKVFAELIRPHFAIVTVTSPDLDEARQLITKKLGSSIPIVYTAPLGLMGRDAITNEFKEIQWEVYGEEYSSANFFDNGSAVPLTRVICLTVGFLPGLKFAAVPLLHTKTEQFEDEFLKDISECTTSVSGCTAPVGIILFTDASIDADHLLQNMDYSMSPETVIVGDRSGEFLCGDNFMDKKSKMKSQPLSIAAIALLFMRDRKKPYGIGDIKLHVALSAGLSPIGHTYEIGDQSHSVDFIGVVKKRKCTDGLEKVKWISSQVFREFQGIIEQYLFVRDGGIETGDCFRFFQPDSHRTSTSLRYVYDKFKDLKRSCDVRSSDCQTVKPAYSEQNKIFGALIFSCISRGKPLGEANVACSLFLENFPDVTLAGSFCSGEICRGDSSSYGQLSERAGSQRCCVHYYSSVYLVMSYTPSLLGI
ncbi:F-box/LRR-repeat protein At5g63520-like isoform X2 [Apium graveolens]|uniref:F-box/LRR-repeat protein At5g63520-like isoform X2 n=1 Tax=Apium graveolens TaxID=4045 RepID=UPI003D7AE629